MTSSAEVRSQADAPSSTVTNDPLATELLALHNVCARYEGRDIPVLSDVDFRLFRGETVLILGPSGCGKSTLALVLAGLLPGTVEGKVTGSVRRHLSLQRPGGVGYVFQDAESQFCMLTVADELAFGLENACVARADMPDRMRQGLALSGLQVGPGEVHAHFSGGMKQKLAIACGLTLAADVLVLDEPTANLDPLATRQVFHQLAQLRAAGQTLVVIEHKFEPLVPLADRVVLLTRAGTVYASGQAADVVARHEQWMANTGILRQHARWWTAPPRTDNRPSPTVAVSPDPALTISGGALAYGDKTVWSQVNVTVPSGSFTAIVGPNGTGKSSLLQVAAGLTRPTAGDVRILGRALPAWSKPELARATSFCFQNPEYQFIYERVVDELANRIVTGDVPADIRAALAEFGLERHALSSPYELSQGEKRRLSVAVMMRHEHHVYLLDEPTFGQDAHTEEWILDRLQHLCRQGKTVILATHDLSIVHRYATQVIALAEGGVVFSGTPSDLWQQPAVMAKAHLQDDLAALPVASAISDGASLPSEWQEVGSLHGEGGWSLSASGSRQSLARVATRHSLAGQMNPPLHLVAVVVAAIIGVFSTRLPQSLAIFGWPLLLMLVAARLSPWAVAKRMSLFVGFYVLYLWSYVAFSRVPPGTPMVHLWWLHPSLYGLMTGLTLAFRMLSAVAFSILFISTADLTDLAVGLAKNFRLRPKFAYGILAGLQFLPLFQSEWRKLRQARQLRGKDGGHFLTRVVTYTLPLLAQAIRLSERVAIAMEARGFRGGPAESFAARTYWRDLRLRPRDWLFASIEVFGVVALLLIF